MINLNLIYFKAKINVTAELFNYRNSVHPKFASNCTKISTFSIMVSYFKCTVFDFFIIKITITGYLRVQYRTESIKTSSQFHPINHSAAVY